MRPTGRSRTCRPCSEMIESGTEPVVVDPGVRTARVAAGATWAELDAATQVHGLAASGPRVSRLEVTSTVTGGPSGWLGRPLGPPAAGVLEVERNHDGRVTAVVLRLHVVGPRLLCGFLGFPRRRARELARAYREVMAEAPMTVGSGLVLF